MTIHTITAFFDDRAHADEAATLLRKAGLPALDVKLSPSDARDEFATFDPLDNAHAPKRRGFWGMLEDLFGGSHEHELYAEGVRRGSTMLTAQADDDHLDQVVEILDRHGSIDLDEREVSWRNDGWLRGSIGQPSDAAIVPGALGQEASNFHMPAPIEPPPRITPAFFAVSTPVDTPADVPFAASTVDAEPSPAVPSKPAPVASRDEDVLKIVEERLVVGKRAVSRGKVRVHSHVVEVPVSEEILLRDETVRVERRVVDRTVSGGELDVSSFHARSIEMEEIDEEAVVSKTARVVEEIGLRKDVANRTETIHDTVRSTKVDIEDERHPVAEAALDDAVARFKTPKDAD